MSRTFDTQGSDTMDVIFDTLAFQAYGNCRERPSSPSGIMQIVTSAVRNTAHALSSRVSRGSWASSWVSLADFSGFICEVEHPSEAGVGILN